MSEPTSPRRVVFVSVAASSLLVRPRWRETARPASEARVMTPKPPTWMPARITTCPQVDQYSPVGTVVRPVTDTAETDVNTASTKGARCPLAVATGRESRATNTAMIPPNAVTARRAGAVRARRSTKSRGPQSTASSVRDMPSLFHHGPCVDGRSSGVPRWLAWGHGDGRRVGSGRARLRLRPDAPDVARAARAHRAARARARVARRCRDRRAARRPGRGAARGAHPGVRARGARGLAVRRGAARGVRPRHGRRPGLLADARGECTDRGRDARGGSCGVARRARARGQLHGRPAPRDACGGLGLLRLQRRGGRDPRDARRRRAAGRLRRPRRAPRGRGRADLLGRPARAHGLGARVGPHLVPRDGFPAGRGRAARAGHRGQRLAPGAHDDGALTNLRVSVDGMRWADELVHSLAHELCAGRWLALGGGGYAVVDVVPRAWAHLVAVASHSELPPDAPLPEPWLAAAERFGHTYGVEPGAEPRTLSDGERVEVRAWGSGFDPADDVDRAVRATRAAVFPHLGLDVHHD